MSSNHTDPDRGKFEKEKPLEKAIREENERVAERQARLDGATPFGTTTDAKGMAVFSDRGADHFSSDVTGNQRHQPLSEAAAKQAHFSDKIYLFPESFNALRAELEHNYPSFFFGINPEYGFSAGWAMVFDAPAFIAMCNEATDSVIQIDTGSVDYICKHFLNKFREMRGVGQIQ